MSDMALTYQAERIYEQHDVIYVAVREMRGPLVLQGSTRTYRVRTYDRIWQVATWTSSGWQEVAAVRRITGATVAPVDGCETPEDAAVVARRILDGFPS